MLKDRDNDGNRPEAACLGKEALTRAAANQVARETRKVPIKAYRCPYCAHWHVGAENKSRRRRRTIQLNGRTP